MTTVNTVDIQELSDTIKLEFESTGLEVRVGSDGEIDRFRVVEPISNELIISWQVDNKGAKRLKYDTKGRDGPYFSDPLDVADQIEKFLRFNNIAGIIYEMIKNPNIEAEIQRGDGVIIVNVKPKEETAVQYRLIYEKGSSSESFIIGPNPRCYITRMLQTVEREILSLGFRHYQVRGHTIEYKPVDAK